MGTDLVQWILEYHAEEAEKCLVLCVRVHYLVERQRNLQVVCNVYIEAEVELINKYILASIWR